MIDSKPDPTNNKKMARKNVLEKYIKDDSIEQPVRTSVIISKEQKQFIDKHRIVLSELVRDVLDDLIKQTKERESK